jgi:hypothetical protein
MAQANSINHNLEADLLKLCLHISVDWATPLLALHFYAKVIVK